MKNIKIIFLWLLLVVAYVQTGYSQMPDASSNFEKVEISFTTTPENPAICNLNKGVKVKVNEPFIRVYWLAPSGARPLIGQDVTLNEFGKWQVKVEKLINGTTCTHTQELMVRDISDPKLIEEYFISNNFFPVTINREAPNPNTDCEAGLEAVNFNGGQNILLQRENFEGFEDFRPFQGMSYVKTITNNNCLCDDTGESKVAEFESKLGSGDLSVWGHQFFANKDVQIGKLFLKASMSWNASSPSGAHKNRLTNILPTILGGLDTREQGRKLFTNLFMNQPIGGYNVADYCNDPEGCYLTENFLTPSGVAIKLPDGASEFVFASSDKPDGVFEGAIIGMANSDGKQMGYHYKNGAFAGYYNDLLATVMDEIEVAPAPEANDELYAFVTRDCMGCKFVRIAVDNIVNTQDEHGGINLPLKSIVTSRFIPSCKERRFRDNLRTDFYVSYLAPTANLIQVPYNDVQSLKFVAGGYETTNVEEVVGGMLWGFDIKIGEGTTCIYKDYTYDVNTKSYITKTGEEYSAEAAGDKGLEDFGYLIQQNNGNLGLFFLTNGGNRLKHVNGEGENYHESFTTLTEVMDFVPFSDTYPLPNGGGGGEKDASNCSFCASSEFSKEIISGSLNETWIFEEKIAQLATKYPNYFVDPEKWAPTPCGFAFTQFINWENPQDIVHESATGNFFSTVPGSLWPWNVYLTNNPIIKAKLNSDKVGFLKDMIAQINATKEAQKEWWEDISNKTSEEIICHLRLEPQNITSTVDWSDKEIALNTLFANSQLSSDMMQAVVHIFASAFNEPNSPFVYLESKNLTIQILDEKFTGDEKYRLFFTISTLVKLKGVTEDPSKINIYLSGDNYEQLIRLEADLLQWSNAYVRFDANGVYLKSPKTQLESGWEFDELVPVIFDGSINVAGQEFGAKKNVPMLLPAIQVAAIALAAKAQEFNKKAWVALDLGLMFLGVGEWRAAWAVAKGWNKTMIIGEIVGAGLGLTAQLVNSSQISEQTRAQMQLAALILSAPNLISNLTTLDNLFSTTDDMNKARRNLPQTPGTFASEFHNITDQYLKKLITKHLDNGGAYSKFSDEILDIVADGCNLQCKVGKYGCFASETKVSTLQGSKKISTIDVGDDVLVYDTKNKVNVTEKVKSLKKYLVSGLFGLVLSSGDTIMTTENHLLWSDGEMKPAVMLQKGDHLTAADGATLSISETFYKSGDTEVYDLELNKGSNYYVSSAAIMTTPSDFCVYLNSKPQLVTRIDDLEPGLKGKLMKDLGDITDPATRNALMDFLDSNPNGVKAWKFLNDYPVQRTTLDELEYVSSHVNQTGKTFDEISLELPKLGIYSNWKAWNHIWKQTNLLIGSKVNQIKNIFNDSKVGYRGSLATGQKFGPPPSPFNPDNFDVDAFIVSDEFASLFNTNGFRDARIHSNEISQFADDLEADFVANFPGYRTVVGKPFTFRVWTETEFQNIVVPNGYKLID